METLKNLSDFSKVVILLLIYSGYWTWWASGITTSVSDLKEYIITDSGLITDVLETNVQLATLVHILQDNQRQLLQRQHETIEQHAKCTEMINNLFRRIEKLEER